ncbi:SpaH/EbpB family LPXTG-anchored major pilin [Streptococcus marmotae]|uniref:SpaH/EbpB family LPXTG-anchored major pilin n=1 Tax=Streptococcus marmotae TaxID=1825069 RepID=UPI000835C054|nr:SpaH/EbpB family LPXTG-anchored major pilin [Streptococcus marmotae]
MKKQKQLIQLGVLAALLGGVVAPLAYPLSPVTSVVAEGPVTTAEVPDSTTVKITKLQAESYEKIALNENGVAKSLEELKAELGADVKGLAGVTFKWYKVTDGKNDDELRGMTEEQLDKLYTDNGELTATDASGLTEFKRTKDQNGTYWVIEKNAPQEVSKAYAVPFRLTFPMGAADGSGYLSEVHVYPKNVTSNTPVADKDVENVGQNEGSYNIGDDINFHLKGTIPKNINDYKTYQFNDTLDSQLDYKGVEKVTVGGQDLTVETHYTVKYDEASRKVEVALTDAGLDWIANNISVDKRGLYANQEELDKATNTADKPYVDVTLKATINETAVLGKGIENSTTITYNNRGGQHGDPKDPTPPPGTPGVPPTTPPTPPGTPGEPPVPPTTPPTPPVYVYTGGKRFVKVGEGEAKTKLQGAEFQLYKEATGGEALKWTEGLIKANKTAIDAGKFGGTVEAGKEIVLKSDAKGEFEIKGLGYTPDTNTADNKSDGEKAYYLQETKAPAGYVVLSGRIEFKVNQTSYNTNPTTITANAGNADPQEVVNNKRPNIPHTGGIGTIIFVVSGLALMGLAVFGLKKDKKHS